MHMNFNQKMTEVVVLNDLEVMVSTNLLDTFCDTNVERKHCMYDVNLRWFESWLDKHQ